MKISVIIPIYNNSESLQELFERLNILIKQPLFINHTFELICVNDGSTDNSLNVLRKEIEIFNASVKIINLTRNFGSYNAFLAGMNYATGKCNIHLHADLQDPPEEILKLFPHFEKGYKLVIANREKREDSSMFSDLYHKLVRRFAISNIPNGGFDLVLFDEKIREDILKISEKNTNNVYLISWLGYEYVNVPYTRVKRQHGKSQWTLNKKVRLFADTLFSFTNLPLTIVRSIFYISTIFFTFNLVYVLIQIQKKQAFDTKLILISMFFFFTNISLVIVVEYLNRIHETVRKRPSFVVENIELNN
jgi:polyisoprenyl-phosphate glycosyltransferase